MEDFLAMGFEESAIKSAMLAAAGNIELATAILLGDDINGPLGPVRIHKFPVKFLSIPHSLCDQLYKYSQLEGHPIAEWTPKGSLLY